MSGVIADPVYALVAEDRGVNRSKLTPGTTLAGVVVPSSGFCARDRHIFRGAVAFPQEARTI